MFFFQRLFYGPFEAVRIWATERFSRIEQHVRTYEPGWGMHSERFLGSSIFTAIRDTGIKIIENSDICVMRARANLSIRLNDCITLAGTTRGMKKIDRKKLVEDITGTTCKKTNLRRMMQLECSAPHTPEIGS